MTIWTSTLNQINSLPGVKVGIKLSKMDNHWNTPTVILNIYFPNAQYMRKICARLQLFIQCAIYAQDCASFPNAQDLREIVLPSSVRNICARL